ncbi:thiamine-monophosphate kinase [Leifsonia xyli subsp. cynodontis DSM 46306]|uniref:Thiamine-monophosphate kinase n=1 Tax=Leifsonia xyli subsp. cynodontis DSM 46306 TaxID=1389489 RepID=U3P6N0_LEIXC|nr:thiamine-phosphate kinase [Leifsonia xyli]AGW41119.1 thiamine-monophosphate kinase [Leifsonia xyli subsp. cynodontis DSM 46306]
MGISGSTGPAIGEASEREALRRIIPRLPRSAAALVGPGDDAAVLAAPDGRYVVTTDLMVHGPDFRLAWSSPADLGWKAAATNLSDVAAMGAAPTALVVAIAAPPALPVAALEEIADGLRAACEALAPGCGVVGGDLSASETLTLAVTAFGDLRGRPPVLRSGAWPGDILAVSGRLGAAAAGLRLLFRHAVDAAGAPDRAAFDRVAADHPDLVAAQLRPTPPIADGPLAAEAGATAMLDLSDGLALEARRVGEASGVAIDLDPDALGPDLRLALTGGEDHSLLASFPPDAPLPGGFRRIGAVREGEGLFVGGRPFGERGGWDPYLEWDGSAG